MANNKRIEALNSLASIRDFLRTTNPEAASTLVLDFNIVAKQLGADPDWMLPAAEVTTEKRGWMPKSKRFRHYCAKCGLTWFDGNEHSTDCDCKKAGR